MKPTPALLLVLLVLLPARADDKKPADPPAPKLPLGRDTTYFNGPLDRQGYVDYEAALNAELGRGVTPEKNANAALWTVFGPAPEGGNGMPPAFFKWLDIPAPPEGGEYFVGLGTFARDRIILTMEQLEAVYEFQNRATQRPWAAKDCPPLADWLKANEKQLDLAARATKLPGYFNPLVTNRKDGEPSSLIGALLPSVQKCRELASAFTCRAMLRLHEGKPDEAWADLLACHRLGRLVSRGGTLIEGLVGIAVCQIAANSTIGYLGEAKLTAGQAAARLKDLQNLPPFTPPADRVDLTERVMGLDSLQLIRRGGGANFGVGLPGFENATEEDLKALAKVDWTPTMRVMNKWYDRMAAAMRVKDRAAREKEFDKVDEELAAAAKDAGEKIPKLLAAKEPAGKDVGEAIGAGLMTLLSPAVRKVQGAADRAEQVARNTQVAFALAAYHGDHGRYPAKLDDLAPKYLAAVPGDLFSGKPLVYKPAEKGYLFYSVGQNGQDDEGRWYDDVPPGDDPRVKMPLPPLKKN